VQLANSVLSRFIDRGRSMMARRDILALLAASAASFVQGCSPSKTRRFKIAVEVATPHGPRSGYSVVEESITPAGGLSISDNRYSSMFRGEAVSVKLPNERYLFALLNNGQSLDMPNLIGRTFYPGGRQSGEPFRKVGDPPLEMPAIARGLNEPGKPLLVTFRNLDDPSSVERVDPENLAAAFGPGYALSRITVEVTEEPVTVGLEKRLTWLRSHRGTLKPNPPRHLIDSRDPDLRLLGTAAFSTELFK